ncbi:hypothetical protein EBZ39_18185, partial [bacterium]|nr:hypothetical protein [bacterium]
MQTHPKNTPKPTFNSYQKNTKLTAIYPSAGQQNLQALTYLALGLAGESGEAVEKIKKIIRSAQPFESQKELIEGLHKELGDVLLHLVFYSRIATEQNLFHIGDVMNALCDKLIFRHPHIYGGVIAETEEEVKQNWEALKKKE